MSMINITILKAGAEPPNPLPDEEWFFSKEDDRAFVIESALVVEHTDGRYPQIQLTCRDSKTKKCIVIGTTARLLNGVLNVAKAIAQRQGLKHFE